VLQNPGGGGPGPPPGEGRDSGLGDFNSPFAGEGPGVGDEGLGLNQRPTSRFGGAAGIVTLIYADGGTYVPRRQRYESPADARMKAVARSGRGRYFSDMHVSGTHIRVLVTGIGTDGALAVALPMTDIDKTLSNQLLLMVVIAAGGIALAA